MVEDKEARIAELERGRRNHLEALRRDIDYALERPFYIGFANANSNTYMRIAEAEAQLRLLKHGQ